MLVATDVAARGLDIPEVDLVIQCEPPKVVQRFSALLPFVLIQNVNAVSYSISGCRFIHPSFW